jgi:high-affinity iron transporter
MAPSFVLALREGLEAALIIGIVLVALRKFGRPDLKSRVWQGVILAVLLSLLAAVLLVALGAGLEGRAEAIYEGIAMLSAAALLTWMIFWMRKQGGSLKGKLEGEVLSAVALDPPGTGASLQGNPITIDPATDQPDPGLTVKSHPTVSASLPITHRTGRAIFLLVFLAVAREGFELALFLTASAFASNAPLTLLGGLAGLAAAGGIGYLLFASTRRLSLKNFFLVTNILLILFAAGLVAHGVHEFNEAGLIPPVVEHVWDINGFLDDKSSAGLLLAALFGYNGNPSLTEVTAYSLYLLVLAGSLLATPIFVERYRMRRSTVPQ